MLLFVFKTMVIFLSVNFQRFLVDCQDDRILLSLVKRVEKINTFIKENGWNKILPDSKYWEYEPISTYKLKIGISAPKANNILEEMGFIEREELANGKKKTRITEKGKQFGQEVIEFIPIPKKEKDAIKPVKVIIWSPKIVEKIRKFLERGEEKDGDTK